ncbi:hypothetical protein ACP70R_019118 [Stipagrostis hirtigluma subsp. patula]
MGACASSCRGRSNHGTNQQSARVAAMPSSLTMETGVRYQTTTKAECTATAAAASPEMEEKRSFRWRIDGFSSLLAKGKGWTSSGHFEIKGLKWYLQFNLTDRKSGDYREYVSLMLVLSRRSLKPDMAVKASFKFLIYDQTYGKHHEYKSQSLLSGFPAKLVTNTKSNGTEAYPHSDFSYTVGHHFTRENRKSGISCMIPLEALKKCSYGFISEDSCVFGVELINLTTEKATHSAESLFVQKTSIFSARKVYTWDIDDFLALKKRCYSPEFEIGGHKWYLSMYPYGTDNSGRFLSLYLYLAKADNDHQGSGVLVEVELSLSIKDHETGNHNKLTGRRQFSAKDDGWGWAKFMWLEKLKDSTNGYLLKGRCCIEADVAIVRSSKME